jgi:hypothetical protein
MTTGRILADIFITSHTFSPIVPGYGEYKRVFYYTQHCKLIINVSIVEIVRCKSDHSSRTVLFKKTKLEITFIYSGK